MEIEIEELKRQNAILRAALEKYADRESWGGAWNTKEGEIPVLSSWAAEMYAENSMAGKIAGGWGVAKVALEEVDGLAKHDALMAEGRYPEAPDERLLYCDICGRSEVSSLISGAGKALIKMTYYEEWCGLVVCEDCPGPEESNE